MSVKLCEFSPQWRFIFLCIPISNNLIYKYILRIRYTYMRPFHGEMRYKLGIDILIRKYSCVSPSHTWDESHNLLYI